MEDWLGPARFMKGDILLSRGEGDKITIFF